ncbi:MAG: hypothetical protein U0572_01535 [Phycisphaerales bacterium]
MANLLKIGQLKAHPRDVAEIARLLAAAERGIADARVDEVSVETRFDAAYRSIMQIGLAALMTQGYRPDTSRPGHHMTIIQTLTLTLGIDPRRVVLLDTLRRKRNLTDYSGEDIDEASLAACIEAAEKLLRDAKTNLGKRT